MIETQLPDMESQAVAYYKKVADYYDDDARDFEQRYEENPVLQRIRSDFRKVTERYPFHTALEIGCGPGFDVEYFAAEYPDKSIYAIDVSPGMISLARKRMETRNLTNTSLAVGSVEHIQEAFGDHRFDMVYVYFGGLNTVTNLSEAARRIAAQCTPGATLVLTFVNRYYLTEIPLWIATGRFDKAFERVTNRWNGYSDKRKIPSRPYSARDVKSAFSPVADIVSRRGYSLFYPAWYRSHLLKKMGSASEILWKTDELLAHSPLWNMGEYSLYVMKVK